MLLISTNVYSATNVIKVDLIIKDHLFHPDRLIIPENTKVIITVENQDNTIEEFESFDLKREKIIFGKSKSRIILAPLQKGEYKFFGEFHEETAQGKIIVKSETELEEQKNSNAIQIPHNTDFKQDLTKDSEHGISTISDIKMYETNALKEKQ